MDFLMGLILIVLVLLGVVVVLLGAAGWLEDWVMRDIRQKRLDDDSEDDE